MSGVGSERCIALNDYSPGAKVTNCTLISDRSCTGVLVTQVSDDVIISNNLFKGSFGGNRAVYVQFLAKALISNNRFTDNTTQHIQIDAGGFAHVKNNEFVRVTKTDDNRAVYLTALTTTGTTEGNSAGILAGSGVIFSGNILSNVLLGVYALTTGASLNGSVPSPELVQVTDNTFFKMDNSPTVSEYGTTVTTGPGTVNILDVRYERNVVHPYSSSGRNLINFAGAAYRNQATQTYLAAFEIFGGAAAGAITVTRIAGANFSCGTVRSTSNMVLTPRTQLAASGASVPAVFALIDAGGATTIFRFRCVPSGTNYVLTAYDASNVVIDLAAAEVRFRLILGPIAAAT